MGHMGHRFSKTTNFLAIHQISLSGGSFGLQFYNYGTMGQGFFFAKAIFLCTMTKKVSAAELNVASIPYFGAWRLLLGKRKQTSQFLK